MTSATKVKGKFKVAIHACRGKASWKFTSARPASRSPKTIALKQNTMMIPNQNSMKNEMIYFDHQWGSSRVREQAARACHDHIRHRRIQNVLHFRVRRHEAFQEKEHPMQFSRIGAEQAE